MNTKGFKMPKYDGSQSIGGAKCGIFWLLGLGVMVATPIVFAVKDRAKHPERANMVYNAYVQYLDENSKQAAATLDLSGYIPIERIMAGVDSAKYSAELHKFFAKNVDKIFTLDDFERNPKKVINPSVIEANIAHQASNNLRFAKRAREFDIATWRYRRAVEILNAERQYRQGRKK